MRTPSPFRAELVALGALGLALLVRLALDLGTTQIWVTFWPAAFFAGWYGGRRAGIEVVVASLVYVLGWHVTNPILSLHRIAIGGSVFAVCGVGFAVLAESTRRSRREALQARELAVTAEHDERKYRDTILAYVTALSRATTSTEVARVLVEEGAKAFGAEVGVFGRRVDADTLEIVAARGLPEVVPGTRFPLALGGGLTLAIRSGEAQFVETAAAFAIAFPDVATVDAAHGAAAALPIEADGNVIGAIAFRFVAERTFSDENRDVLRTLVAQAAQAFQRAELFVLEQRSNARRKALNELSTLLAAAGSIEEAAHVVTNEGMRAAVSDTVTLFIVDERAEMLHMVSQRNNPPDLVDKLRDTPLDGEYAKSLLVERWVESREHYVATMPELATLPTKHRRAVAFWSMPLTAGGRIIGVLAMGFYEPRQFSDDEREFVRLFAGHCAQAIARAERARAAEAADRAKDDFLAMLGHELRNPLAPMTTALELLEIPGAKTERVHGILRRQVQHLTRMVDDLLDVSRIKSGKIEITKKKTELHELVGRSIEMVSPLLEERRHRLVVDVPATGMLVDVDPTRMSQVIANILMNAAKYTEPQGEVRIAARNEGAEIVLDISDTGFGIEPELLQNIFELFTQAPQSIDRARGGLGLGLAIARTLVAVHGGTLTAHSDGRGKGSRFTIRIARTIDSKPMIAQQPDFGLSTLKRVLVVDDNRDAADMLAALAEHRGHTTRHAGDGPDALRILQDFSPDVALLDVGLPVMDGYELAQRIRQIPHLSKVRLVAVTGYGQPGDREKAREAGFDLHLVKPVQLEDVLRAIEDS